MSPKQKKYDNESISSLKAVFPRVFPVFIDISAFLHTERKGDSVRVAHVTKYPDIFLAFKKLCVCSQIIQPYINFGFDHVLPSQIHTFRLVDTMIP